MTGELLLLSGAFLILNQTMIFCAKLVALKSEGQRPRNRSLSDYVMLRLRLSKGNLLKYLISSYTMKNLRSVMRDLR